MKVIFCFDWSMLESDWQITATCPKKSRVTPHAVSRDLHHIIVTQRKLNTSHTPSSLLLEPKSLTPHLQRGHYRAHLESVESQRGQRRRQLHEPVNSPVSHTPTYSTESAGTGERRREVRIKRDELRGQQFPSKSRGGE